MPNLILTHPHPHPEPNPNPNSNSNTNTKPTQNLTLIDKINPKIISKEMNNGNY